MLEYTARELFFEASNFNSEQQRSEKQNRAENNVCRVVKKKKTGRGVSSYREA
jgi:hypothetical protein